MKKQHNFRKLLFVLFVVAWSFYEMYPPVGRNLAAEFQNKAVGKDKAFSQIAGGLQTLDQERPQRAFPNLVEAVGTNDITRYFPWYEVKNERNPSLAILNRLQAEAAGKNQTRPRFAGRHFISRRSGHQLPCWGHQ